jgi:hypothetical protein
VGSLPRRIARHFAMDRAASTLELLERPNDEHPQVRSAAVWGLERDGVGEAVDRLLRLSATGSQETRAEWAGARIIERAGDA